MRVPWTANRSYQSILKEISPGWSLEGLMLRLKFPYFGQVMTNLDSIFKSRNITLPTKVHLVKAMLFLWSYMDVRVGL